MGFKAIWQKLVVAACAALPMLSPTVYAQQGTCEAEAPQWVAAYAQAVAQAQAQDYLNATLSYEALINSQEAEAPACNNMLGAVLVEYGIALYFAGRVDLGVQQVSNVLKDFYDGRQQLSRQSQIKAVVFLRQYSQPSLPFAPALQTAEARKPSYSATLLRGFETNTNSAPDSSLFSINSDLGLLLIDLGLGFKPKKGQVTTADVRGRYPLEGSWGRLGQFGVDYALRYRDTPDNFANAYQVELGVGASLGYTSPARVYVGYEASGQFDQTARAWVVDYRIQPQAGGHWELQTTGRWLQYGSSANNAFRLRQGVTYGFGKEVLENGPVINGQLGLHLAHEFATNANRPGGDVNEYGIRLAFSINNMPALGKAEIFGNTSWARRLSSEPFAPALTNNARLDQTRHNWVIGMGFPLIKGMNVGFFLQYNRTNSGFALFSSENRASMLFVSVSG